MLSKQARPEAYTQDIPPQVLQGPWTTQGEVRGSCGHAHRSWKAVLKCLKHDQDGCRMQGGYSDRRIVTVP